MWWIFWAHTAVAHPFDARWFGHRVDVLLQPDALEVDVVVEIPMIDFLAEMRQEFANIPSPDGSDLERFGLELHQEVADAFRLVVNDTAVPWDRDGVVFEEPTFENQFAILTLHLSAPLPADSRTLNLINGSFPDELSIFSTQVRVSDAIVVDDCSLLDVEAGRITASRGGQWRTEESSRELRMSFRTRRGLNAAMHRTFRNLSGTDDAPVTAQEAIRSSGDDEAPLQALVRGDLTPLTVLWGLVLAVVLGAFHAMSPGHGKTLVAAYLLGERKTVRHAFWLGAIVTITHTLGVVVLGVVALMLEESFPPEVFLPWMTLLSGLLVLGVGASLFRSRLRQIAMPGHGAGHGHSHPHAHDDAEAHGAAHAKAFADSGDSWWGIVSLGVSGGLVPCPSALVLLLTAVSFHRTLLGLVLLVAFSLGLASLVTAVGVAAVVSGNRVSRLGGRSLPRWLVQGLPLVSAVLIVVIGMGIVVRGMGDVFSVAN